MTTEHSGLLRVVTEALSPLREELGEARRDVAAMREGTAELRADVRAHVAEGRANHKAIHRRIDDVLDRVRGRSSPAVWAASIAVVIAAVGVGVSRVIASLAVGGVAIGAASPDALREAAAVVVRDDGPKARAVEAAEAVVDEASGLL